MSKELQQFLSGIETALMEGPSASASDEKGRGVIQSYKDGVIHIKGLSNLKMNEVVEIESVDAEALVMNLEKDSAYALVLQSNKGVREGLFVKATGRFMSIPVSKDVLGRVIDALGVPLDGKGAIKADKNIRISY
jgi:F-type H+-transporting ATPase subunit alpha